MSKRLILVLALAFVLGISLTAYAEVQNVKVSGDLTVYGIGRKLDIRPSNNDLTIESTEKSIASIARVKIDADLTDNVMTTVRLLNERYWGNETDNVGVGHVNTEIDLDLALVTMKEFLYSPLSLTVGRQELHFGNDMIVGDYDTNNVVSTASAFNGNKKDADLSARKAFDAIRATLNYDPLVIDLVAAKITDTNLNTQDDVDLYGVNANYKLADTKYTKNSTAEVYWFEKRTGRANSVAGLGKKVDSVDTVGGRITTQPITNDKYVMTASLEAAYQGGQYVTATATRPGAVARKAWALESALNTVFPKAKYTPSATLLYSYFSGNKKPTATGTTYTTAWDTRDGAYHGWDPMFENQATGSIANALFNQTNAHVLGGVLTAKPMEDVSLKGEYYAYWWAKAYPDGQRIPTVRDTSANILMTERRFAGQEIDLTATYDYTEDVQFGLMGGFFVPGPSFNKDNNTAATEVIGSMKVTF